MRSESGEIVSKDLNATVCVHSAGEIEAENCVVTASSLPYVTAQTKVQFLYGARLIIGMKLDANIRKGIFAGKTGA